MSKASNPLLKLSLSWSIIKKGSTDKGLVSQAFTKTASGAESTFGVRLKGLVLKAFHRPELISKFVRLFEVFS